MDRKLEGNMRVIRSGQLVEAVTLVLLLVSALSASQVRVVYGIDDSTMNVTVSGESFHVKLLLEIELSVSEYDQFEDAEDAYSRDAANFRGRLRESMELAIQGLVSGTTVTNLKIVRIYSDEEDSEMHVELEFDVDGAITTLADGSKRYDLTWRSFKAERKFRSEGRTIDPCEALGLDFSGFGDDLDNDEKWNVEESGGNTVIRQKREYRIDVNDGDAEINLTQKFTLPSTTLTISNDTVQSSGASSSSPERPFWQPVIDFFNWLWAQLFNR